MSFASLVLEDRMRCGVVLPGGDRSACLEAARGIEALGFDSLWVGDHLSFHIPVTESLSLLAFAAAATERIELCTGVYLLPLRPPVVTAKVTATVDALSDGRLVLGVGVGGEFPPEFQAVQVPVSERGSRADESIEIVRRLWREDAVVHRGKHFEFGPISIAPKPKRPGGPPIVVGGRKAPSMRRAGRLGDGYISHMCDVDTYESNLEEIDRHASEAGRGALPFRSAAFLFTTLDDSYEAALDRAASMLGRIYNVPFREAAQKYTLLGRPEDCLEQIRKFARAGARHIVLSPLGDPTELRECAAAEILPELHNLL